jgi:hypothetical protein
VLCRNERITEKKRRKVKKRKDNIRKEKKENKIVNYRIEACRRVLISTPLYQVGAGNFVT